MPQAFHAHIRRHDPVISRVIKQVALPYPLRPQRKRFEMLVRSIVFQQISMAAARTIHARLINLAGPPPLTPQRLAALSIDELRSVGLSRQKANYIWDLAHKVNDGTVPLATMGRLDDEAVIAELTKINGVGRWTAQMFLMFALGRPNVFPVDDLGLRMALRDLYSFQELPAKGDCLAIGSKWSPFASVGTWYCWRYLDQKRAAAGRK